MTKIIIPILAAGLLAACGPPANLAGVEPARGNNTTTGVALGAATGAILTGIATGGALGETAAGAVVGAALGGAIGNRLDMQAKDLEQAFDNDAIKVENQGEQLLVSFPQEILFATDSADLKPDQRSELNTLATNLAKYPDTKVQVIGHTDNTGSAGHNFDLSARRAGSVSAVLVDSGVAGSRVSATGKGEDNPIASNLTEDGRSMNRRVEVVIKPTA